MDWEMLGEHALPREMHLLVSSMSARGRAIEVGPAVVRILRAGGWKVTVSVTTPEDTPQKIAAASRSPFVAALGGDGYLSAVAQGVHDTDAVFIPMPGGRGNDLCRALGVSHDPYARAREVAAFGVHNGDSSDIEPHIRDIDGIWVRDDEGQDRLVLGIVAVGYEARANEMANASWFRSGPMAYAYGAFAAFATYTEGHFRAVIDGEERDLTGWVASVSNSGCAGGGIRMVPTSDLEDGQLELFHIGRASKRTALAALTQIVAKRNADHPLVHIEPVREVYFNEPVGAKAWADGDPVATIPCTMRIAPSVVRVLA